MGKDSGERKKNKKDQASISISPLRGLVIVERIYKEATAKFGILVPRQEQEMTNEAYVFHSGFHPEIVMGQKVILKKNCGTDISFEGYNLSIIQEEDILGVADEL